MPNPAHLSDDEEIDSSGERTLRGVALKGTEQKNTVEHAVYESERSTDEVLRVDAETDTLYDDGLDIAEESGPPAGAPGSPGTIP